MVKSDLETRVNKNLFSNHYLDNLIQKNPEWKKRDHERAFQMIKDIYIEEKSFVKGLNEPQLEERFFQKIFKIFLPDFEVQAPTEEEDFPDYAFFPNRQVLDKAHENKGTRSFYVNAFAIGEVKKWGVELDRFGRDKYNKRRNPSFQIWLYLNETEPKWGILSNGRKWRLYHEDKPLDCYYEIDLVTLLENDDIEGFKYFYYFFMKEALIPSKDGVVFIETVLGESLSYAKEIGENLKENVYKAMEKIVEGFFNWPQNELDPEDERIRLEVQKSAMRLLYRFLFLLYAEGKGLLNLKDEQYRTIYSFYRLKKEIKDKKEGPDQEYYSPAATTLWSRLKDLFRLIDQGSEVFDIPKDQFYVPPYNGGLFDPKRNPKLEELTIEDTYLADAVDLLARSGGEGDMEGFVDYSTLEIRHLGSIYEGLFEYKLKLAERDMVVKGGKKKRIWVTLEEFNKKRKHVKSFEDFDEFDRVQTGELYLTTDKGERKATGSYYTPDYIVNYIVKNTINPVVEQKWKEASKKGQSLIDATLSVKVLDPAMGSGHFLVGAVELLAGKLLEA
ncbi:MAG: class I SAM-dependent DNA methyltransferase, partial [Candidatus Methanofastidiosia archaeon]